MKPTKQELEQAYVAADYRVGLVADCYKSIPRTVKKWLVEYQIPLQKPIKKKRSDAPEKPTKERLRELYLQDGATLSSVAKILNTSHPTVREWLKSYGIPIKSHLQASQEANRRDGASMPTRDELQSAYADNISLVKTARSFKASQNTIYKWLSHHEIEQLTHQNAVSIGRRKNFIERLPDIPNLVDEYASIGHCKGALAARFELTRAQVDALFDIYKIEVIHPRSSRVEIELLEWLRDVDPDGGWRSRARDLISPQELDIVSDQRKLAIEYCGLYWHSQLTGSKASGYHRDKLLKCREIGYDLITVFETDDLEKVKRLLLVKTGVRSVIGARKCKLVTLNRRDAIDFENKHHIAGSVGASLSYGLVYNGEILSVASFSKPRYNQHHDWELSRYTLGDCGVIGGAARLIKHHALERGMSLISYADLRFGDGSVYESAGLQRLPDRSPCYWYFQRKSPTKLYHRSALMKHKLPKLLGNNYDASATEWQNAATWGWDRIYDCGQAVWISNP